MLLLNGWGFADGTIGMITPIEDMVNYGIFHSEKNLCQPWDDKQLIPLGTPLMAYGFDAASMDYFNPSCHNINMKHMIRLVLVVMKLLNL